MRGGNKMRKNYKNCLIKYDREDDVIIIENIEVKKENRNKGFAKRALKMFLNQYKHYDIELHAYGQDIETDNEKLREFYEKLGFEVVAGNKSDGYEMKI